jgi:hypothetical protein
LSGDGNGHRSLSVRRGAIRGARIARRYPPVLLRALPASQWKCFLRQCANPLSAIIAQRARVVREGNISWGFPRLCPTCGSPVMAAQSATRPYPGAARHLCQGAEAKITAHVCPFQTLALDRQTFRSTRPAPRLTARAYDRSGDHGAIRGCRSPSRVLDMEAFLLKRRARTAERS